MSDIVYKKLQKKFISNGWEFTEVKRVKDFAIYYKKSIKMGYGSFEVFKVRKHDGYEIAGNKVAPAEIYPSDEQFGKTAWSTPFKERSEEILKRLLDKKEEEPVEYIIPEGKFTSRDFIDMNPDLRKSQIYTIIKDLVLKKKIVKVGEKKNKIGKDSSIYKKNN